MKKNESYKKIQTNVPLADKNWFRTGGSAHFFTEPSNYDDFRAAIEYANSKNLEMFVLGQGANILISDNGFDGLVIRPAFAQIAHKNYDHESVLVTAGAGTLMDDLILYCLDNNILGLEEFSGIPGTVGGSIYINIHYFKFSLAQFLQEGTIIDRSTGEVESVKQEWFNFGYDYSTLFQKKHYLLEATFKLKKANMLETAYARGKYTEIIRHRTARYPTIGTCGCFFRNFKDDEVTKKIEGSDRKMIYTAYYLDKIGAKGELRVGDAVVSHQHANMIVNIGNATSSDIIELAIKMQTLVKENFGIIPKAECQLIGFYNYPLLK